MIIDDDPIFVSREELELGKAVPWAIFDRDKRLLLKKGTVITSDRQIEALLMRGAIRYENKKRRSRLDKREEQEVEAVSESQRALGVFAAYQNMVERLEPAMEALSRDIKSLPQYIQTIESIAGELCSEVRRHPDRAITALHLVHEFRYIVIHPIHVGIAALVMAQRLGYDAARRHSLACASLTQNLSMNVLQEELQEQVWPLDDRQLKRVHLHPIECAEMLARAGVEDQLWLEIVAQHHEREDGSGYPNGILGEDILEEARLINLGDRYAAMLSERSDRDGFTPQEILRTFVEEYKATRDTFPALFVKELGIHPPGTFVHLANGETALVVKRATEQEPLMVVSYINPRGYAYDEPIYRSTGNGSYVIKAPCKVDLSQFNLPRVWDAGEKVFLAQKERQERMEKLRSK